MAGEVPPCLPWGAGRCTGVGGRGQQRWRPWDVKACPRRSGRPVWTHGGSQVEGGGEAGSPACCRGKSTDECGRVKRCLSQNLKTWPCLKGVFADVTSKVRPCWVRVGPESSGRRCFNKGTTHTETHGEGHVKTEAETRVTKPQDQEGHGWRGATRSREEAREGASSPGAVGGSAVRPKACSQTSGLQNVGELISVVLALRQPQDMHVQRRAPALPRGVTSQRRVVLLLSLGPQGWQTLQSA